jgi:hypothetical protein
MALNSPREALARLRLQLDRGSGIGSFLARRKHAHVFPVVGEFFSTIQAHNVSPRLRGGIGAALSSLAGQGKAHPFVPASEQSVKDCHKSPPDPEIVVPEEPACMGCHRHLPAPSGFFGFITSVTCLVLLNPSSFHGFCKKAIDKKCHSRGSAFYFQYENGIGLDFLQLGLVGVIKTSGRRQSSNRLRSGVDAHDERAVGSVGVRPIQRRVTGGTEGCRSEHAEGPGLPSCGWAGSPCHDCALSGKRDSRNPAGRLALSWPKIEE